MSTLEGPFKLSAIIVLTALFLAITVLPGVASTFWTGSTISFTHDAFSSTVDELTTSHVGSDSTNNVWLTRGTSKPLYNAAAEPAWNGTTSPVNTQWATNFGAFPVTLANTNVLQYDTFDNVVGQPGNTPENSVGGTFFVHIISDDIYLELTLTAWGMSDGGSFSYTRTTPAVVSPTPTVSLTNPVASSVFAAPAALKLKATASVSSGVVSNVQFFANATPLGSVTGAPFNLTSGALSAGTYSLTAVATAAGISATSTPVNVSVVNPVNTSLSAAHISAGQFQFTYNVNTGLTYFVQSSSNLLNWVSLSTNTPSSTPVLFSAPLKTNRAVFYNVGRLPNP